MPELVIDNMDRFFAEEFQRLADDMERDGTKDAYPADYEAARIKAKTYRDRIVDGASL